MDCVYIDFIFKTVSNSEYLHVNLKVSLNKEIPECHWYTSD